MLDKNWPRWLQISIDEYLGGIATTESLPYITAGIDARTRDFMDEPERVEFRVNGPFTSNPAGNDIDKVFINVIATSLTGDTKNKYKHHETLGIFYEALREPIPIFKYGDGPDDDDSHIGCLRVLEGNKLGVRVIHFTEVDPTDNVKQGMVAGAYEIEC